LVELLGKPEWADDSRFSERAGWRRHLEGVLRPAIEGWASTRTMVEACNALSSVGIAAGPCFSAPQVIADHHVAARNMLVEVPRTDGVAIPVLVPGNPIKLSNVAEGPESRVPWLGEHTDEVLKADLGLTNPQIAELRAAGVIG
jgi:formyl-CoA transferase